MTTGLGQIGLLNVQLSRFQGQRPRLFGQRRLLAMSAGGKSLPNVKELTGGRLQISFGDMRTEPSLCQRGGIPSLCSIWTLVVFVVLAAEQVLLRPRSRRLAALASES